MPVEIKYLAVKQKLLRQIQAGEYPSGKLPSLRRLAIEYGISLLTAQRAVKELEAQQIVICRPKQRACIRKANTTGDDDLAARQVVTTEGSGAWVSGKTRLCLYAPAYTQAHQQAWQIAVDEFQQQYPWIRVEWDSQSRQDIQASAGQYDVFDAGANDVADFRRRGLLQPLAPKLWQPAGLDGGYFSGAAWRAAYYNGVLYGLPHYINLPVMFYNPQLAAEIGGDMDALSKRWNWNDFMAYAEALHQLNQAGGCLISMAILGYYFHRDFWRQMLAENQPDLLLQAVNLMKRMVLPSKSLQPAPNMRRSFEEGAMGFLIEHSYFRPFFDERCQPWLRLAPLPLNPEGRPLYHTTLFCMGARTTHVEEAWLLLKHIATPHVFQLVGVPMGRVPVHRACLDDPLFYRDPRDLRPLALALERDAENINLSTRAVSAVHSVLKAPLYDFLAGKYDAQALWASLKGPLAEILNLYASE